MYHHYVYITRHIDTGQYYIGLRRSTVEPHLDPYMGSGKDFRPLYKQDPSKWEKFILSEHKTREEAAKAEAEATVGHLHNGLCLNRTHGGSSYPGAGLIFTEEHRRKMSEAAFKRAKRPMTEEHKEAISKAKLAQKRKHTPEAIQAMKDKKVGHGDKYRKLISIRTKEGMAKRDNSKSEETREKLRAKYQSKTPEQLEQIKEKRRQTIAAKQTIL